MPDLTFEYRMTCDQYYSWMMYGRHSGEDPACVWDEDHHVEKDENSNICPICGSELIPVKHAT